MVHRVILWAKRTPHGLEYVTGSVGLAPRSNNITGVADTPQFSSVNCCETVHKADWKSFVPRLCNGDEETIACQRGLSEGSPRAPSAGPCRGPRRARKKRNVKALGPKAILGTRRQQQLCLGATLEVGLRPSAAARCCLTQLAHPDGPGVLILLAHLAQRFVCRVY